LITYLITGLIIGSNLKNWPTTLVLYPFVQEYNYYLGLRYLGLLVSKLALFENQSMTNPFISSWLLLPYSGLE
jgi:hypothetical protein